MFVSVTTPSHSVVRSFVSLAPDFWVGNGHKWLYSPHGSAILYVAKDRQALIEPTCISDEGHGPSFFEMEFSYQVC
jgi:selenocysteine lyase/cysteine desulfurase